MRGRKKQTKTQEAKDYFWNSAAGILNAGQSVLILMVITRVLGMEAAGLFSIAFATGNLFMNFGNFGVRNVQVSDQKQRYGCRTYLVHRAITTALMLAGAGIYVLYKTGTGYTPYKAGVVFAMCLLKAVDCIEDAAAGRLQQRGRLDLAGKMILARLLISLFVLCALLKVSGALLIPTLAAAGAALLTVVLFCFCWKEPLYLRDPAGTAAGNSLLSLTRVCFPVCAANCLSFYLINAPKYAIDAQMDEIAQAQYTFIAMPVFVIQLLNQFLYQPLLVKMTLAWEQKPADPWKDPFLRLFGRVLAGLGLITAAVLAGGYVLGIPVLGLLYSADLTGLRPALMLLLTGGAFLALNGFLTAMLTIVRAQKLIPLVYFLAAAVSVFVIPGMVRTGGLQGASAGYLVLMALVSVLLILLFVRALTKRYKDSKL